MKDKKGGNGKPSTVGATQSMLNGHGSTNGTTKSKPPKLTLKERLGYQWQMTGIETHFSKVPTRGQ
jgi:hypothetical protein